MRKYQQMSEDYQRVEKAIRYIEGNLLDQPNLDKIAQSINLSPYHFQKLFTRWTGVSPKRYLQYLTKEYAKQLLEQRSTLDTAFGVGLSSPGRLHDLFVTWEGVSPGEHKNRGEDITFYYDEQPSPFGLCRMIVTERGIWRLEFVNEQRPWTDIVQLQKAWSGAQWKQDSKRIQPYLERVFSPYLDGAKTNLSLFVQGTPFQIKVWEGLLQIPAGSVITYHDLAVHIGLPQADRAVGSAVGKNPLSVLIPCHRVISRQHGFGNYRWGPQRKKAILAWEISHFGEKDQDHLTRQVSQMA
jgi:AraC family transcriptional regulator of adaptative response/methylated-DNA-[protein]-cysteine methyltransferase